MAKRIQLSIIVRDDNVVNGLIVPYKKYKKLNELINRMLSAYYYNEEVRSLVYEDYYSSEEPTESAQEIIDKNYKELRERCDAIDTILTEAGKSILDYLEAEAAEEKKKKSGFAEILHILQKYGLSAYDYSHLLFDLIKYKNTSKVYAKYNMNENTYKEMEKEIEEYRKANPSAPVVKKVDNTDDFFDDNDWCKDF